MSSFIKRFFALAKFDSEENLRRIKEGKKPLYEIPSNLANPMMDYMLERSYLEDISSREEFVKEPVRSSYVKWIKISRLPVSPLRIDDYDLLSRWQGVLSSMPGTRSCCSFFNGRTDIPACMWGIPMTHRPMLSVNVKLHSRVACPE